MFQSIPLNYTRGYILRYSSVAVENTPFIHDFPMKPSIYRGFPVAMFELKFHLCFVSKNALLTCMACSLGTPHQSTGKVTIPSTLSSAECSIP